MNKEGTEENFLRAKNTAVYESNNMVTDVQSGEILYQEKSTKVKTLQNLILSKCIIRL